MFGTRYIQAAGFGRIPEGAFIGGIRVAALVSRVAAAVFHEVDDAAQLEASLRHMLETLQGVRDAASAARAVEPLKSTIQQMQSSRSTVDEAALLIYLENTAGAKRPFIVLLQQIAIEFTRLNKADFYATPSLRDLLAPQMLPPAVNP